MMQIDVNNVFNNIFRAIIFKELQEVERPLASIILFTKLFYGAHFFSYQHKQHEPKGVTIIKSSSSTRKGDPLKGLLFVLTHYQTFLKPLHKP